MNTKSTGQSLSDYLKKEIEIKQKDWDNTNPHKFNDPKIEEILQLQVWAGWVEKIVALEELIDDIIKHKKFMKDK